MKDDPWGDLSGATQIDPRRQPSGIAAPVEPSEGTSRFMAEAGASDPSGLGAGEATAGDWADMVGMATLEATSSNTLPAVELEESLVFPTVGATASPFEPELPEGLRAVVPSEDPTDSGAGPRNAELTPQRGNRRGAGTGDPAGATELVDASALDRGLRGFVGTRETYAPKPFVSTGRATPHPSISDLDLALEDALDRSGPLLESQPVTLRREEQRSPPPGERTLAAPGELAGLAGHSQPRELSHPTLEQPEWNAPSELDDRWGEDFSPAGVTGTGSMLIDEGPRAEVELGSAIHAIEASPFELEPPDWHDPQRMEPHVAVDATDDALEAMDSRPVSMPGEVVPSPPGGHGWFHEAHGRAESRSRYASSPDFPAPLDGLETLPLPHVEVPEGTVRLTVATLPRRFGALVVDAALAAALLWAASSDALFAAVPPGREPEAWLLELGTPMFLLRLVAALAALTLGFGLLEGFTGRTPGKLLFGLRTRRSSGAPLGVQLGLTRAGVGLLGLLSLGIGYAWILLDRRCRGLHGILTGTLVIQGRIEGT